MHDLRRRHIPKASLSLRLCALMLAGWLCPANVQSEAAPASGPQRPAASQPTDADRLPSLITDLAVQDKPARRAQALDLLRTSTSELRDTVATVLSARNNDTARLVLCDALAEVKTQDPSYLPLLLQIVRSRETAILLRKAAAAALSSYRELDSEVRESLKAFRQEYEAVLLAESHAILMKALYDSSTDAQRATLVEAWLKSAVALERYTGLDIVQQSLRKGRPESDVIDDVRQLLGDPDEAVRQKAVFVLRTLGQKEDARYLRDLLRPGQAASVREAVYSALGVLGDVSQIPVVIEGLNDRVPSVAAEAATALARLIEQQPPPADSLVQAAVGAMAARASQKIDDPILRERLIDAMATVGAIEFLPILMAHAGPDEPLPAVRQAAIRGLGHSTNTSALPLLVQQLSRDPDTGVRQAAAEAIGHLAMDCESLAALRKQLHPASQPANGLEAKAWQAYLEVFSKLSLDEQAQVLAEWSDTDAATRDRRIEMLLLMEQQATRMASSPRRLVPLREQLADALLAASRGAEAGPVLSRQLELMRQASSGEQVRVARKMLDAYLRSAPEKAIASAATLTYGESRQAAAQMLLDFIAPLISTRPDEASQLLQRLQQGVPDGFGEPFASQFKQLQQALPQTSRPASGPATAQ